MPAYSNTYPPSSIVLGDSAQLWVAGDGNFVSNTKTQRVALCQRSDGGPMKLALRVSFSGAPGTISLQLQTSDTDVDTDYNSEGSAIAAVNGSNVARLEVSNVVARFARVLATTVTNAVTATVELTA
jgi:hypothetical protein